MKKPIEEIVGENVLNMRHALGLSQRALADKADISQRVISNIEQRGGGGSSGIGNIAALAEAMGVPLPLMMLDGMETDRQSLARCLKALDTFLRLSPAGQEKVLNIMEDYLELSKTAKH